MSELTGKSLSLPLVAKLATLKHHATHTIRWHTHDELEIHYVLSGALTYELTGCRAPFTISGGSFFIIPPHRRHRAMNDAGSPSVRLGIQLTPPASSSAQHTVFTPKELKQIFSVIGKNALVTVRFRKRTEGIAREIYRLVSDIGVANPPRIRTLICSLLLETVDELSTPGRIGDTNKVIPALKDHIREHCGEALSVNDLVRISGYGRTRLFTLFTAEAGITPIDFLNRCRIDRAQDLIRQGATNLQDIASACGFSSSTYFISVYRKYTGTSPRSISMRERQLVTPVPYRPAAENGSAG